MTLSNEILSLCRQPSLDDAETEQLCEILNTSNFAVVNFEDNDGNTPLILLCHNNTKSSKCVEILLKNTSVYINATNKEGFNALHILCAFNRGEVLINIIRMLVSHKIDVNAKSRNGSTVLNLLRHRNDIAAIESSEIIQLLLEHRAIG